MVCRPCNFGLCERCSAEPQDEHAQAEDVESAGALANICDLGFTYTDASIALRAASGNVEQAVSLLLAAADIDMDAEGQLSEFHG
jgi:hypothetical protein